MYVFLFVSDVHLHVIDYAQYYHFISPVQTELLVKQAGVKMDGTNHADAEKLFAKALELNPNAPDALLHRANLRMIQQRVADAESDLQTCVRLYPNNLLARLRLATVFMAKEDMSGAKRVLDEAAECDPDSSEVHCYRGGENSHLCLCVSNLLMHF
jgi:Tfp pilus assembly protein PilF